MRARDERARSLACAHERATAAVQLQLCVQAGNAGGGMEAAWWAHSVSSLLPPSPFSRSVLPRPASLSLSLSLSVETFSLVCPKAPRFFPHSLALFIESFVPLPRALPTNYSHPLSLVVLSRLLIATSYFPSPSDDSSHLAFIFLSFQLLSFLSSL